MDAMDLPDLAPVAPARHRKRKGRGDGAEVEERCLDCNVTETPLWRWDPYFNHGVRRVCNRCGCKAARSLRKQTEQNDISPSKRHREAEDDEDQKWDVAPFKSHQQPSSSDGDSESQQDPLNREGHPTHRPKRFKRSTARDDEETGDAHVTVQTLEEEEEEQQAVKPKRPRATPRKRISPMQSRRHSQAGGKGGRENVILVEAGYYSGQYVSFITLFTYRKHPRKQASPSRGL